MAKKLSHEQYLETLNESIWTPLETYINARTKILHRCCNGHEILLFPRNAQNSGCQKCKSESERLTNEEYISRLIKTKWTPLEEYITTRTKILHICTNGHRNRLPPRHAQEDVGCIECNAMKDTNSVPGILYYVRFLIKDTYYYKIGITRQKSVRHRFLGDITRLDKVIMEKHFSSISEAHNEEQKILKTFSKDRRNLNLLHAKGNTEIFDYDILNMDD